jgi:hypothetical protein
MYHSVKAKEDVTSIEVQTERFDSAFLFTEMVNHIKQDNDIKGDISQKVMMDLFYEYFDFQERIKNKLLNLPMLREGKKEKKLKIS